MKPKPTAPESEPIVFRQGSSIVKVYPTVNRIYRANPVTGLRELKSEHPQFTLVYYSGSRRVKQKFSDRAKAETEAQLAVTKLANGELEALKLTGADRADYIKAIQRLRQWRPDADLNLAIADYVATMKRLPVGVTMNDCADYYLKRHPAGLPPKTVRQAVDELIKSKTDARKSDIYVKDLEGRLYPFADKFQVRLSSITGQQVEEYIRALRIPGSDGKPAPLSGRTQNNHRRIIGTLFKFAVKRGYLPRDHDELSAVERAEDDSGEIEIFAPDELEKLFAAAQAPVKERGKFRNRETMIPYLAIGAFAGLRAAELQRLDWSEVNLTRRFIEIKASKAKTASRRLAPVTDNLAAWLAPYAETSGPVAPFANMSKQLTERLAPAAGLVWKHNGLRHSFISYRLAAIKDVGQVALEAGNSPQMIFKHYRQLVTEEQAKQWFAVLPPKQAENILPMTASVAAARA
jgi:integrase